MKTLPLLLHKSLRSVSIQKVEAGQIRSQKDHVAVEQFLELHLIHGYLEERERHPLLVTMCSPGYEADLAVGLLFNMGVIQSMEDVMDTRFCPFTQTRTNSKVIIVELEPEVTVPQALLAGRQLANSACGLCGTPPEHLDVEKGHHFPVRWQVAAEILFSLPGLLIEKQALSQLTGGIHAAAFIEPSALPGDGLTGDLRSYREDVGRHNALDKVIGSALASNQLPLDQGLLLMSSRASYELLDKARKAGIHFLATIGAPSSLAVELAKASNMTLVGFLKIEKFNVYAGAARIVS